MSQAMRIAPSVPVQAAIAVLLGASSGSGQTHANYYTTAELGKFAKLVGESRYALCAVGNPIEARISAVEPAPNNGYVVGGVNLQGQVEVTFDGLQATPGTGAIAVGDYVVCGTVVAKDTALTAHPKVCKATNQPNAAVVSTAAATNSTADIKVALDAALVKAADAAVNGIYAWRVVSLGSAGSGAVGTTGVISRESA